MHFLTRTLVLVTVVPTRVRIEESSSISRADVRSDGRWGSAGLELHVKTLAERTKYIYVLHLYPM